MKASMECQGFGAENSDKRLKINDLNAENGLVINTLGGSQIAWDQLTPQF